MLNVHFMRRTKYLPPLMRACEALEKIRTKVHSAPRATREQMELVQQVINRKYTPSVTGAEMYFYACETDQHRLKHLGINPITDTTSENCRATPYEQNHYLFLRTKTTR